MPKYLVQANYTLDGVKGLLLQGGSKRRAVVQKLAESLGGSVENMYYAFGESDLFIILDLPNNVSMATTGLLVAAGGGATIKTTVLLTPEEMDEAAEKTGVYTPPGQ
jgi:uncharacterized protein with GYD domain